MGLPKIALTVGDPAGIGPEIVAKAAADPGVLAVCKPIVFSTPPEGAVRTGIVSAAAGRAAYATIVRAVDFAKRGDVDAIATAPINKLAFAKAGLKWKGHTDLIAHLCDSKRVAMMFHSPTLKVVLITVHVPLKSVSKYLTPALVDQTISLTVEAMKMFGTPKPRLALAGLNPHAGENGVLGDEDDRVLVPAVRRARARRVNIEGPIPGDTVFVRAVARRIRLRDRVLSRSGVDPGQAAVIRQRRQRHDRVADHPHLRRSRHRVRYRRQGRRRSRAA